MWLDGADSRATASITMGTWIDKSMYNSNATGGSTSLSMGSINSIPAVTFPTASVTRLTTSVATTTVTGYSVFFVANMTANATSGTRFITTNSDSFQIFSGTGSPITIGTYVTANFATVSSTIAVNTPFLYSGVITPYSFYEWVNGASNSTAGTTGSMTGVALYIGNDATPAASNAFVGQMGEVIVYNRYLQSSQRQAIEGYLAWKWGLSTSSTKALARPHPFYQMQPLSRSFTPIDIPGCIIWADAAQLTSLSGSWLNWSPQGTYTLSCTGTLNSRGKNNLSTVSLTTTQTWTTSPDATVSSYTMFFVGRQTGGTNKRILQSGIAGSNALYGYWNGGKKLLYIDGNPNHLSSATSDTAWDLMSHSRTAYGSSTFNWNGTSVWADTSTSGNNLAGIVINTGGYPAESSDCEVGEIILYNSVLASYQIEQVEGYLAWKWALNTLLPSSTHSFYIFAPLSPTQLLPTNISRCVLWLDAADTSTVTGTTTVSGWVDKSGNANNVTSYTGSAALTQNSFNGVQAILFGGTSSLTGSLAGSGTTLTVCIVGSQRSGCPANAGLVCFSSSGVSDSGNAGSLAITNYTSTASGQMLSTRNSINSQIPTTGLTTPFVYILIYDGTYVNTYLNGSQVSTANITSGGTFAFTTYVVGDRAGSTATNPWRGTVGEVVVYSSALAAEQRTNIEGYLAWKWGVQNSLPSTHSYYKFTPSQISPPMAVFSVAVSLTGSTLTATWAASPDAVSYTADLYSSSTSGGTYAFVSTQTVTAATAVNSLSITNYYKVYVTVNGAVDKSATVVSAATSYTASASTWSFTSAYSASGSTGTPTLAINGSLVTTGVSNFADTITGQNWWFNTHGYGGYTNPVATALTIDATYKAIKLPGTTYGFLSYGVWDQSTLAYPGYGTPGGFAGLHTALIIYRKYGANIGSGGEGAGNAVASGSIIYTLGRSSAYNYPTGGGYAGEIIVGEQGMWTYGFGGGSSPSGFGNAINGPISSLSSSTSTGWVCEAFAHRYGGTSSYFRVTGSAGSYTVSTPATTTGNMYVDGSLYVGVDQRDTFYGGDYGNLLNGGVAFFGMWNAALTSTQIANFIASAGPQFGTFI